MGTAREWLHEAFSICKLSLPYYLTLINVLTAKTLWIHKTQRVANTSTAQVILKTFEQMPGEHDSTTPRSHLQPNYKESELRRSLMTRQPWLDLRDIKRLAWDLDHPWVTYLGRILMMNLLNIGCFVSLRKKQKTKKNVSYMSEEGENRQVHQQSTLEPHNTYCILTKELKTQRLETLCFNHTPAGLCDVWPAGIYMNSKNCVLSCITVSLLWRPHNSTTGSGCSVRATGCMLLSLHVWTNGE